MGKSNKNAIDGVEKGAEDNFVEVLYKTGSVT